MAVAASSRDSLGVEVQRHIVVQKTEQRDGAVRSGLAREVPAGDADAADELLEAFVPCAR